MKKLIIALVITIAVSASIPATALAIEEWQPGPRSIQLDK